MVNFERRELLATFIESTEAVGDLKPAAVILWNFRENQGQAEISYIEGDPYTVLVLSAIGESKEQFEVRITELLKKALESSEGEAMMSTALAKLGADSDGLPIDIAGDSDDWEGSPGGTA